MSRTRVAHVVRLPLYEEPVPPIRIFDGEGRLVRIVPAHEFRRAQVGGGRPARSYTWTRTSHRRRPAPNGEP
jgi:hypothetical protein